MSWTIVLFSGLSAVVLFFVWANAATRRSHARFGKSDVEAALEEFVSPSAKNHDTWDLFLSWPIDDRYCESIRQECLEIVRNSTTAVAELDPKVEAKVEQLLARVRCGG